MKLMSDSIQSRQALQAFARLNFAGWQGLPEHTRLPEVFELFRRNSEWTGAGSLGSEQEEHPYLYVHVPGFEQPARVWLQNGDVVLIDAEPAAGPETVGQILKHLDAPEATRDSYLGTFLLENSEWIYASRGLTLFVNPENRALLRIAIYPACGLDHYLKHLRLSLKMIRTPQEAP
jgi:hypothetical protein